MATRSISHFITKSNFSTINSNTKLPATRVISMAQTESYWASIEAQIDTYLKKSIPIRPPESVFEPMHHLTFAAPRTSASALCVAACELVGGDRSQALAAAAAIHLMHAAAYTHENLLLTDRPKPRPTVEHKYGPNVELLTGDGIIPFGFELLARSMENPDRTLRVIIEISRAGGSQGIFNGIDEEYSDLEVVCKKKEGEVHACGAACGAILGGGTEAEIEKLRNFGLYAGIVKGMVARSRERENPVMEERIGRFKELALKELESFNGSTARLELISSLVEPSYEFQAA